MSEPYSHHENTNHPQTNGTYDDQSQPVCCVCNKPIETAEDGVLCGEFSRRHRTCPDPHKNKPAR